MPNPIVKTITDIISKPDVHVQESIFEFDEENQKIIFIGKDLDDPLFG